MSQTSANAVRRDQGLARAAQLRTAVAVGAAAATAIIAYAAGSSIPGHASASTSPATTSSNPAGVSAQTGLQAPQQAPGLANPYGGQAQQAPLVSSGGS